MSRVIYKYPVRVLGFQTVKIAAGGKILTAQAQDGGIYLWVEVDKRNALNYQYIGVRVFGTGHEMPDNPGSYLSTVQLIEEGLVFHIYVE